MTTNQIISTVAVSGIRSALVNSGKWLPNNYFDKFALKATIKTQVTFGLNDTFTIDTAKNSKMVNALSALKTINALNAM